MEVLCGVVEVDVFEDVNSLEKAEFVTYCSHIPNFKLLPLFAPIYLHF